MYDDGPTSALGLSGVDDPPAAFDEMFDLASVRQDVRPAYDGIATWIEHTTPDERRLKAREAEVLFRRIGITFAVYSEGGDPERLIPFDIIPRILATRRGECSNAASRSA